MENSFKKGYDKTVNDDGSFEISFKAKRFGSNSMAGLMQISIFILLPASCVATMPAAKIFGESQGTVLSTWATLAIIVWTSILHLIINTRSKISVKPKIGIVIGGKNLPFTEMDSIGTISAGNTAFVYAGTNGTQVRLSKYISQELAHAIAREIKDASGINWK